MAGNTIRTIIMVDDDEDDFFLVKAAMEESALPFEYRLGLLQNGEELMDYLHHRSRYSDPHLSPRPCLILLDLNMPRKDGREALREIKAEPRLSDIPVVVYTTSSAHEDRRLAEALGVTSFVTKPSTFDEIIEIFKAHANQWLHQCI